LGKEITQPFHGFSLQTPSPAYHTTPHPLDRLLELRGLEDLTPPPPTRTPPAHPSHIDPCAFQAPEHIIATIGHVIAIFGHIITSFGRHPALFTFIC
jgi:hypothetical protein